MESIQFDRGMRNFKINGGGVLRFNPADPNVYARFMQAQEKLEKIQQDLAKDRENTSPVKLLQEADAQVKALLGWVFGLENDFDHLLGGVSLLALAGNGEPVVVNLFSALAPILEAGAKAYIQTQVDGAVGKAKIRRQKQC